MGCNWLVGMRLKTWDGAHVRLDELSKMSDIIVSMLFLQIVECAGAHPVAT